MSGEQAQRRAYSLERLAQIADGLRPLEGAIDAASLCVYATGSYGRLEAWERSDIDLFFLCEDPTPTSGLTFLRVAGRLVEITEDMQFPPFSGDGKYLERLDVGQMERVLGSRQDDDSNMFTARMLLLLESRAVADPDRHQRLLDRIVGFYYHDFADHGTDFAPNFLINDVLRFWRTLTLNYEHDRFEVRCMRGDPGHPAAWAKIGLKNFKLKVSRLATCFSMVVHLASEPLPVTAERVVELCGMTPQERFAALAGRDPAADAILEELERRYEAFLLLVQQEERELLEAFSDEARRRVHLAEASCYGNRIFELIQQLVPADRMRHLIV